MAGITNVFNEKETNNWFKACIALNVTKEGLTTFVETVLQQVQAAVGKSCGNCSIENLMPCPTQDLCKRRKRNYCTFHKSQLPQPCIICDQVKSSIISMHIYSGPSWRNTKAECWATDCWEIGKCFLPPDGYSSVSSVQESDFNGIISVMLNCKHFETCLSLNLSPKPPDPQCPLEKVRQIGREVRHTADCKVTDAALQDILKTLSTLLADPMRLVNDTAATTARTKLSNLQHDRLSLTELGELLKDAKQTLENAKKAGERFSEKAESTLAEFLQTLEATIDEGEQRVESKIQDGEQRVESKTQDGEQRIESKIQDGEQRVESKIHDGEKRVESKIQDCELRLKSKIQDGEQRVESKLQYAEQRVESKLQDGEQRFNSKIQLSEERVESKIQDCEQRVESTIQAGEQRVESKIPDCEQRIESKVQDGEQRIESKIQDGIACIEQAGNAKAKDDYERDVEDLRRRLVDYYNDTSGYVPLTTLDQSLDKRLKDIYTTPKIHRINIEQNGHRSKNEQVLNYNEIFYKDNISNRRIYVQGEPGRGKSTFAAKLIQDWCHGHPPSSKPQSEHRAFVDVVTIQHFKFVFFISLRNSRHQKDVTQMIQTQLINKTYTEDERECAYKLFLQILKTEMCLVVQDGLDEWPGDETLPSMAGIPNDKCIVLITSRPWKLADERIKNSQIDVLFEIEGISNTALFSKMILQCIIPKSIDLYETLQKFHTFILTRNLWSLLCSPMLHTLVLCTWVNEEAKRLTGTSLCGLYTILLESLCKKANVKTGYFNTSNPLPVICFSNTKYIQPNIKNIDAVSKAAFSLLFSSEKETSIVFSDKTLSDFVSEAEHHFALNAGILSQRKSEAFTDGSNSFIHKSVQEFLAAYHIATNTTVIDDVISEYLSSHADAYLDISQVFKFLCGLNISAANDLSRLMNECDVAVCQNDFLYDSTFQDIIQSGYREAAANMHTCIDLKLSNVRVANCNVEYVRNMWGMIASNAQSLDIVADFATRITFNLSSCHKLKYLRLRKDYFHETKKEVDIWIPLFNADAGQCADHFPVLPSIERIYLCEVTLSSIWLRRLFNTLLTLGHKVECRLVCIHITSCSSVVDKNVFASITTSVNNTFNIEGTSFGRPGLWYALHGLSIKNLSLSDDNKWLIVKDSSSLSQSLASLKQLDTLNIDMGIRDDDPLLPLLHDLNIQNLSLKLITSGKSGLCEALRGLNITSLSLNPILCRSEIYSFYILQKDDASWWCQLLLSLTRLETLKLGFNRYTDMAMSDLYVALRGLKVKSLSLCVNTYFWDVSVSSLPETLSSLTLLETLEIDLVQGYVSTVLWEALRCLNIKSLSLRLREHRSFDMESKKLLSLSLASLRQLETLRIKSGIHIDLQPPLSLKYFVFHLCFLSPSQLRDLVNKLLAGTQTLQCELEFCSDLGGKNSYRQYSPIKQELEAIEHVEITRFGIRELIGFSGDVCDDFDDDHDGDILDWPVINLCCGNSRILMRFQINGQWSPAMNL